MTAWRLIRATCGTRGSAKCLLAREATLRVPEEVAYRTGGKKGLHTEHLGPILAEMQYLQRVYPGQQW